MMGKKVKKNVDEKQYKGLLIPVGFIRNYKMFRISKKC